MVLPAGLVQHWERCAAEVFAACFLAFLAAAGLLIAGKATRSTKLPFAPFFLAAVLLMWIAEAPEAWHVDNGGMKGDKGEVQETEMKGSAAETRRKMPI